MAVFIGTIENRVDKKGRVSVPASFRAALGGEPFGGIAAFPSWRTDGAIEACGMSYMERLSSSVGAIDLFSEEQDALASLIFSSASQIAWDGEGRIIIPPDLIAHAGIADRVAFVGRGELFQLWEPERFRAHKAEMVERARRQRPTLKVRPAGGEVA